MTRRTREVIYTSDADVDDAFSEDPPAQMTGVWSIPHGKLLGDSPEAVADLPPDDQFGLLAWPAPLQLLRYADGATLTVLGFDATPPQTLVVTEAGLFAGSETAFGRLHFAQGASTLTAVPLTGRDVASRFHRPDLLTRFLQGAALPTP